MNIFYIAQIIGTISILLLFIVIFVIALSPKSSKEILRISIIWTAIYIFFLFILRLLLIISIGDRNQLSIISGFTSPIPLVAIIIHLLFEREIKNR